METRPYFIHALSPLHAGTGQSPGAIDLPIARLRATGIPFVPGSSIKGVLRDSYRRGERPQDRLWAVFGPDTTRAADHAGALVVGDARLLVLPVRSLHGTFAWVTSPLLLRLARRDMAGIAEVPEQIPDPGGEQEGEDARRALVADLGRRGHCNVFVEKGKDGPQRHLIFLEDLDLPAGEDPGVGPWADFLATCVEPDSPAMYARRLVVVDDETMTFLWETATQVDARIRLDDDTRTVAEGQLWLEESLPAEALLVGLLAADRTRRPGMEILQPGEVLDEVLSGEVVVQLGGKASVGRGRCRLVRVQGAGQGGGR